MSYSFPGLSQCLWTASLHCAEVCCPSEPIVSHLTVSPDDEHHPELQPAYPIGQTLVLSSSDLSHSFPVIPRRGSAVQVYWNVQFARQQAGEFPRTGHTLLLRDTTHWDEGAHVHRPQPGVLPCNSVIQPLQMCAMPCPTITDVVSGQPPSVISEGHLLERRS